MSVKFLDLQRANARQREVLIAAAARVIDSGWYVLGAEVARFERAFAGYCGAAHCIGVGNGLDALVLILRALLENGRIDAGDEVIVPANTFAATLLAVEQAGLKAVLVDPDPATHNLDPLLVQRALTPKTRVLMPVHLYGRLAPMEVLMELAGDSGLLVVEDAAQAHGARARDRAAGTFGIAAGFSFYPGKNLGALGDAGAVVTSDDALATTVRALRNYGSSRKYVHESRGVNSRLDEMQAALLSEKLNLLDSDNERRRTYVDRYLQSLADITGLELPSRPESPEQHVWHLFVVRHPRRDALQEILRAKGVETLIHYPIALADQPAWRSSGFSATPVSSSLAATVLSLPLDPGMCDAEVAEVIECVKSACSELSV